MLGGALLMAVLGSFFDRLNHRGKFSLRTRFVVGGALVVALITLVGGYSQHKALRNAVERGEYRTVEGVVKHFAPAREWGDWESFNVGNDRYQYSDSYIVPGYHRTALKGGVMRDGLRVRIADVDGQIARLEIRGSPSR
jgi:hypothetical protein